MYVLIVIRPRSPPSSVILTSPSGFGGLCVRVPRAAARCVPRFRVFVAGVGVEPRLHAQPPPGQAEQGLGAHAPPPCRPPNFHGAAPAQVR